MLRFRRCFFVVSLILLSWLLMQAVHETGHILAAWLTGAKIEQVVLHPLTFSRTDVAENPQPLCVYWSGAIFGVLFPLLLAVIGAAVRLPCRHILRFFAGFCLVANGSYLGFDFSDTGPTDAGFLIEYGAERYQLLVFGTVSVALGLFLWHGQSKHFGFGREAEPVSKQMVWSIFVFLFALVALEVIGFECFGVESSHH
jgi:peptidoglycan/LPS O-acetylase OafA/YrhL